MPYETDARQLALSLSLTDEWYRSGVRQAVICPGSRSTLLTVALLADERFEVIFRLDERSAGFFAIGLAIASMKPVLVVVTSGTAAAELHAAVAEADLSQVPLILCTADRPAELHDVFAPQTINQNNIFSSAVRYFFDMQDMALSCESYIWRSVAARIAQEAISNPKGPGPVHLNLPFREPFFSRTEDSGAGEEAFGGSAEASFSSYMEEAKQLLSPGRSNGQPWHLVYSSNNHDDRVLQMLLDFIKHGLKVIVVAGWLPRSKGPGK